MSFQTKALIIVGVVAILQPGQAFGADYDDGLKHFYAGQYQQAAIELSRSASLDPGNALTHYFLANSFVFLKRHKQAIDEYKLCYALHPPESVAKYCKDALSGYQQLVPDSAESQHLRDTLLGAQLDKAKLSQDRLKEPQFSRSLSVIRRQLEWEKKKHESVSEATAQDTISTARKAVSSVEENAEQQVQKLYAPQPRRTAYLGDLTQREQQIRAQAKEEEEYILRQAQNKAERYRELGELQKTALDQVADNLENQLADDGKNSGVRLVPQGTNLYVRSYASVRPVKAVPEVHAAVGRIYAGHSQPISAQQSAAAELQGPERKTSRSVEGKILK